MLRLRIAVSGDGLGAKLRLEGFTPSDWRAAWAGSNTMEAENRLRAFIESQGIAPRCIRGEAVKWICQTLTYAPDSSLDKDLETVQGVDVAAGEAPVHDEPQGLVFHHSYLSNPEAIADLRRKSDGWGFEGIREAINPVYWVSSGETVLSFQSVAKGQTGHDVFGAPIPTMSLRDRLPPFGKSLHFTDKKIIAICEGALIIEDGQLKVLGADSLPTCQVAVAEDGMSANLILGGNHLNDWTVTTDAVQSAMREQGVVCTVPEPEIQGALNAFNQDHLPVTLMIARGRPPTPGQDGRLSMLIDPEPDVPIPSPDGTIDFKAFTFFRTVAKGARLARVLPPVTGEPGMNVYGQPIPPPEPKAFASEPGPNTALEGFEPLYLISTCAGRLAMRVNVPEVVEVLEVPGDVSIKTGNIDFPGAIKIAGDVHSGMQVHSVGDVEVVGTVEDSVIRSDGAIVVKGGVNGAGGGIIKSRLSSVTIGYLHNQRIESNSHIVVFNEIINSILLARKSITMKFGRFSVLGGTLLAGEKIDLFNVGSEAGSKTILEVGKDFEVEAEMAAKNARLIENSADLEFLRNMEDQLAGIVRLRRSGADEATMLQKRTQGAMQVLGGWITGLRAEIGELSNRLYNRDPVSIVIHGTAYPGTVLKYRDNVLVLPQQLTGRRWVFRGHGGLPPIEGLSIA